MKTYSLKKLRIGVLQTFKFYLKWFEKNNFTMLKNILVNQGGAISS